MNPIYTKNPTIVLFDPIPSSNSQNLEIKKENEEVTNPKRRKIKASTVKMLPEIPLELKWETGIPWARLCPKVTLAVLKNRSSLPLITSSVPVEQSSSGSSGSNHSDGEATFLIFNFGDSIIISDLKSQDHVKTIQFGNSYPVCHEFDSESTNGHDFLIAMSSGDVYLVSLREQLQATGKNLVGSHHYNKDGHVNNSCCSGVAWVNKRDGIFIASHINGALYVYEKVFNKKYGENDPLFPEAANRKEFSVIRVRNVNTTPLSRWNISDRLDTVAVSHDGRFIAAITEGVLQIFDFVEARLLWNTSSFCEQIQCVAWSPDGKYILAGGDSSKVFIWSMDMQKFVASGDAHISAVVKVAFDSSWDPFVEPTIPYRFISAESGHIMLWNLKTDDLNQPMLAKLAPVATCAVMNSISDMVLSDDSLVAVSHRGLIQVYKVPVWC